MSAASTAATAKVPATRVATAMEAAASALRHRALWRLPAACALQPAAAAFGLLTHAVAIAGIVKSVGVIAVARTVAGFRLIGALAAGPRRTRVLPTPLTIDARRAVPLDRLAGPPLE